MHIDDKSFVRSAKVIAGSTLVVIAAAACSGDSPKAPSGQTSAQTAPAPAAGSPLAYFEGAVDTAAGTMTLSVRETTGQVTSQTTLPWGTTPGNTYMHKCGTPTYGAHVLTGTVQAVNLMSGTISGVSAVIDSITLAGVTLASGPGSGSASGMIATYGNVLMNAADCSSMQTWSFNDPTDANFTFYGHVDGEPPWTVATGFAAAYDARVLSSLTMSGGNVSGWADLSGHGENLTVRTVDPVYNATLINGQPGLNFASPISCTGAACPGMISPGFALNTQVTVFAVITWNPVNNVQQWANIAFHVNRDNDWSLEQDGVCCGGGTNIPHFQSCNDNSGDNLTLIPGTTYILEGRIDASNNRTFSATSTAAGTVTTSVTNSNCISPATGPLYVGNSDANEAFDGYYGELLYYSTNLTDPQVASVIAALRTSWGI